MAEKMLKIELHKSLIGRSVKQIATANSLGLKKPGDVTVQPDNTATQGKVAQIAFLLKVSEVAEKAAPKKAAKAASEKAAAPKKAAAKPAAKKTTAKKTTKKEAQA